MQIFNDCEMKFRHTLTASPVFQALRSRWDRMIFSSPDLEEEYCHRIATNSLSLHTILVAMFFISMSSATLAYFGGKSYSEANLVSSIAMWVIHFAWLLVLRFRALPVKATVKVVPVIVLMLDMLILAAANPEAQNHFGIWNTKMVCNEIGGLVNRCFRDDYWLNAVVSSGMVTVFGIYLIPCRQSVFAVPAAWALHIILLMWSRSGTALRYFTPVSDYFWPGIGVVMYFSSITLALRYTSESCDRELFWTHRAQLSACKAQEEMVTASRRLCRSVFDMVFFLKEGSLEFYDKSQKQRFVQALRAGNLTNSDSDSFTDFFIDKVERERFRSYIQECSFDVLTNQRAELPAQLISVLLRDGSGLTVSTKVYCTRFQKLNFEHPFEAPDEFLLVGLMWEGTSPMLLEHQARDSTTQANVEPLSVSHLLKENMSRHGKSSSTSNTLAASRCRQKTPSYSTLSSPQKSMSSEKLLTSIPEDLKSEDSNVQSEGVQSGPPAPQAHSMEINGSSTCDNVDPASSNNKQQPLGKQKLALNSLSTSSSAPNRMKGSAQPGEHKVRQHISDLRRGSPAIDPLPCFIEGVKYLMQHIPAEVLEEDPAACCHWHGAMRQLKGVYRHFEASTRDCNVFWMPLDGWKCNACGAVHDEDDYKGHCMLCGANCKATLTSL
eukprot:gnl/MRDRNA2_/MRDRNA2_79836_c0_seq2.p1 gnl/MRDRNA2_/MRDRNA2_79836_c0~~gnl/MRDRNA2_/MRDRNA2_79836_c0_seq2.p1  ORF type:complete len:665 (-),score=84.16 gnl/MRDRNA2_/MRDRNA2_79836_c0_seq2:407-2401(-)